MAVDELTEFKRTFFQECDELLGDLEGHLTALKDGQAEDEVLNAAFRAIHSIKGGAGAFGFSELVTFAHVFENVLDLLRSHKLELDDAKAALLIRAADVLADLVAAARTGTAPAAGFGEDVLRELHALAGTEAGADNGGDLDDVFASALAAAAPPAPAETPAEPARRTLTIRFAPGAEMFRRANDPLLLIRELKDARHADDAERREPAAAARGDGAGRGLPRVADRAQDQRAARGGRGGVRVRGRGLPADGRRPDGWGRRGSGAAGA